MQWKLYRYRFILFPCDISRHSHANLGRTRCRLADQPNRQMGRTFPYCGGEGGTLVGELGGIPVGPNDTLTHCDKNPCWYDTSSDHEDGPPDRTWSDVTQENAASRNLWGSSADTLGKAYKRFWKGQALYNNSRVDHGRAEWFSEKIELRVLLAVRFSLKQ